MASWPRAANGVVLRLFAIVRIRDRSGVIVGRPSQERLKNYPLCRHLVEIIYDNYSGVHEEHVQVIKFSRKQTIQEALLYPNAAVREAAGNYIKRKLANGHDI